MQNCSLAVNNNEFILGRVSHLGKALWDQKLLKICYLFNISHENVYCTKISDIDELKRRINSEWAALKSHGYWMCSWLVAPASTCLRSCWMRTFWAHAVIKMMWHLWLFKRQLTITASYVCRYSVSCSNVHFIIVLTAHSGTSTFPR